VTSYIKEGFLLGGGCLAARIYQEMMKNVVILTFVVKEPRTKRFLHHVCIRKW